MISRICLGSVAPLLLVGLVSCGREKAPLVTYEISQTVVYRGVYVGRSPLTPGIAPRVRETATVSLSVVEAWDTRQQISDPVGPETTATIDSVNVGFARDGVRSIFHGRFDHSTSALTVSGAYWLNGTMVNGRFVGIHDREGFIAIPSGSRTILAYLGSWSGTRPSGDADRGILGFLIDGTTVTGIARNDDGTVDLMEGSYGGGEILMTFSGYTLRGSTSRYAIFGRYEATLNGGRLGMWTTGPYSF